ncbi:hypothetical protein BafACA1_P29 (plasmid) [Borreliella afzelii ACA-1]|nr:hypothetical protein BafACA1_P29 [Borreliella afzelii ACA-1]
MGFSNSNYKESSKYNLSFPNNLLKKKNSIIIVYPIFSSNN